MRDADISLLSVLTPVTPGREEALAEHLCGLGAGSSPFARLSELHFARWVIIGEVRGRFPRLPRRRPALRMKYLLYTCGFNGPSGQLLENLRTRCGAAADGIWGHCVGYPGCAERQRFREYFGHNALPIPHQFLAYQHTVGETREALDLRAKHVQLACATQGKSADAILAGFREVFG